MTERLHLSPQYRETIAALLREHLPGVEVWAYGSRVNGRSHDGSDLDLALRGPGLKEIQADRLVSFTEALRDSTIPFLVDARDWARLPEGFHREIEREHVVLVVAGQDGGQEGREEESAILAEATQEKCCMDDEWCETTLGHVIELKRGYDLPQRERMPGRVPVVSSSGLTDHHSEIKVRGPGVVTGRYGTLGQVFFIPNDFWPLNTTLYVRDFKGHDPQFISYFLRNLDFSAYSDKAAVPGLNRNHLHQEIVHIPTDVREQRAIAHILGTLDDKIELNRRRNETLEAMARALFKSWFVDFDPVRAKMEGRDTGLPQHLADLFPDRLVESELGEIPEGWEVGTLDSVALETRNGLKPTEVDGATPYIGLQHMPRRNIALSDWGRADEVSSGKLRFRQGQILFGKLRPYFHKVGIAPLDGVCSTDVVVMEPRDARFSAFGLATRRATTSWHTRIAHHRAQGCRELSGNTWSSMRLRYHR